MLFLDVFPRRVSCQSRYRFRGKTNYAGGSATTTNKWGCNFGNFKRPSYAVLIARIPARPDRLINVMSTRMPGAQACLSSRYLPNFPSTVAIVFPQLFGKCVLLFPYWCVARHSKHEVSYLLCEVVCHFKKSSSLFAPKSVICVSFVWVTIALLSDCLRLVAT